MAPSANLPIYREAYRLVSHLHQSTRKAPRDLRHTLVQRLLDEAVELCVDISDANRNAGSVRSESLGRLQRRVGRVDTLLTIAREQHCLSTGAAAVGMEHVDKLGKQAHGWAKQTAAKVPVTATSQSQADV
jgi:hypothetical protein